MSNYVLLGHGNVVRDTKPTDKTALIAIYETVSLDKVFVKNEEEKEEPTIPTDMISSGSSILSHKQLKAEMTLEAMWLNEGGTRLNMPSMKIGELVKVYQYEGSDRYHFTQHHLEKDLRRKETVVHGISNLDGEKDSEFGKHFEAKTSYHWGVSSEFKKAWLETANNDGEAVTWKFFLDTKAGIFKVNVNGKEKIVFNGAIDKLTINIKDIELNGSTLMMKISSFTTLVTQTFNNESDKFVTFGLSIFKKVVDFKSKCKFNKLSRTAKKKEPLE